MAVKFGVPPEGERIRSMVEERLKQAMAEDSAKVTVEWRGEQKHLSVISMPVDLLYFNPDTHRIRAQRTLDPEQNRVLEEEPWSEPAQDYLALLLSRNPANPTQTDPDFTALQDELDDFGQKEPGIISPNGILVDGNTRCAALRKIGVKDIRVGVLPADTSRRDINNVELALQLRKDKRREYSYINRLIAIEEELANGRRPEDVARDFNIKTTTLRQDRWVYQLVNDAIDRSKDPASGVGLRLVDFEDHQEKLRELQRDYTKLAKTDPDAAEQLKESRLAMVVLNYPKTSVRLAEADFHSRFLDERLPDDLRPAVQESAAVSIPGLPGVAVQDGTAVVKATRALTDDLLRAKAATLMRRQAHPLGSDTGRCEDQVSPRHVRRRCEDGLPERATAEAEDRGARAPDGRRRLREPVRGGVRRGEGEARPRRGLVRRRSAHPPGEPRAPGQAGGPHVQLAG